MALDRAFQAGPLRLSATDGLLMRRLRQTLLFSRNPNLLCERSETDFHTQPSRLQRPSHAVRRDRLVFDHEPALALIFLS